MTQTEVKAQINVPPKLKPVFVGSARYRGSWAEEAQARQEPLH